MASENLVTNVPPQALINVVNISGDLVIEGSLSTQIRVRGDNPKWSIENDGQRINISCNDDCHLYVPQDVTIAVGNVGGDARIKSIDGNVSVQTVGGDFNVRDLGALKVGTVGGDADVKRIAQSVSIESIGGDIQVREVGGDLTVEEVPGDAIITRIGGSCEIDSIGGDLVLNLQFIPGQQYEFSVGGDVKAQLPLEADVTFQIPADTEVDVKIAGTRTIEDDDQIEVIVGSGVAQVVFTELGGELELINRRESSDDSVDVDINLPEDFNDIINARIHEQISYLREQIDEKTARIREEAQRAREIALGHAERARDQARGKAKRQTGEFRWDWSWPEKRKRGDFGPGNFGPEKPKREAPSEPVSDQERLTILKMVENKQITVEEAERLLSALEG